MKRPLIKSLLALLLVLNPVAVLASDFHDLRTLGDKTTKVMPCHPMEQLETHSEQPQHDATNCDMPCRDGAECSEQGICVTHYNSDVLAQKALRFYQPNKQYRSGASISTVPDREHPPENPPPIHI